MFTNKVNVNPVIPTSQTVKCNETPAFRTNCETAIKKCYSFTLTTFPSLACLRCHGNQKCPNRSIARVRNTWPQQRACWSVGEWHWFDTRMRMGKKIVKWAASTISRLVLRSPWARYTLTLLPQWLHILFNCISSSPSNHNVLNFTSSLSKISVDDW